MAKKTGHVRREPTDLIVEEADHCYRIVVEDVQLMTSIGMHPVTHAAPDLLNHIIDEFMGHEFVSINSAGQVEEPVFLGAYRFFGLQKEWVETGQDTFTLDLTHVLAHDPLFQPLPGPEVTDQYARWGAANSWLADLGVQRFFGGRVSYGGCEAMYGSDPADEARHLAMAAVLVDVFERMYPEEKSVAVYLSNAYNNAVVHSLALVAGKCTPREFAVGVLAANHVMPVLKDWENDAALPEAVDELVAAARAGLDYIASYRIGTAVQRLLDALNAKRETGSVEFKSTLRWNVREGKKDRAMTDAVVKTITGFLNTEGGTLVIGVDDDAVPVGIELDAFDSDDKFLRHLYTSLTNAMGPAVTPLVKTDLVSHAGKTIALVEAKRGPKPVTVKAADGRSLFYVRTGPATIVLSDDQLEEWTRMHWST